MLHLPCHAGLAAALTLTAFTLPAQTWTEVGAGSTSTSSETPLGRGPLTSIQGTLAAGQAADIYLVHVDDPATFRASTAGGASFDTQLWVFDVDGRGLTFRDDDAGSGLSTVSGQFLGGGTVLIAVSEYDNDPLDSTGVELWNDTPYAIERQPDGPGAGNVFTQWSGTSATARPYTLTLAGASFAAEASPQDTQVAFAWIDASIPAATFVADVSYQHTPTGERIIANRLAPGRFRIDLPGHLSAFGNVQVTTNSSIHTTVVETFAPNNGKLGVWVNTVDLAGVAVDAPFQLVYRVGGRATDRTAYLMADQPTTASYPANPGYAFNGNRGVPTIARLGVGYYSVTLPGLATVISAPGHVQVSPITINTLALRRAQVVAWAPVGADLVVQVQTKDGAGSPVDETFLLAYTETAADQPAHLGSGAFVWAHDPTAPSYAPSFNYTASNGTAGPHAPITITRSATGTYAVTLPDHNQAFGVPMVSLHGATPGNATTTFWTTAAGGGTVIDVECRDAAGALADRTFLLQWTSAYPAGTPARNEVVGAGCNGSTLLGATRPVLGGSWQLELANVAPTAVVPFTLLSTTDPGLPLDGLGMPGCVLHADLNLLVVFLGNPAATVAVPNLAALLGVTLMAQGGALDPTQNAFGAGLSNAIRGVIGDV